MRTVEADEEYLKMKFKWVLELPFDDDVYGIAVFDTWEDATQAGDDWKEKNNDEADYQIAQIRYYETVKQFHDVWLSSDNPQK